MHYLTPWIPFLAGWAVLLATRELHDVALVNGLAQALLFAGVVCIPAWRTGRMSYVDIGWPWGLVVIGIATFVFLDGYWLRNLTVSLVYALVGVRMGGGALALWRSGHLQKELPRYQYQRLRWERAGKTRHELALQVDVIVQGLANCSFLAFPAFVIGVNPDPSISAFELLGLVIWLGAFAMESVADAQKLRFLKAKRDSGERNQVCTVGLWRYSRHPNYFAEWMVWNALVVASIPSWLALHARENLVVWLLIGLGLLFVSRLMYSTLVYYTGAVPAEHYSAKKRPEYQEYQAQTNRFFPGPYRR
jgi:steroid 5-alpha reductase family enzyme